MRLAQRALDQGLAGIGTAAGEGDLAGVAAEVAAPLGEDQSRPLGPAEERDEDGGAVAAVSMEALGLAGVEEGLREVGAGRIVTFAQMITCTVPPSTPPAAPRT